MKSEVKTKLCHDLTKHCNRSRPSSIEKPKSSSLNKNKKLQIRNGTIESKPKSNGGNLEIQKGVVNKNVGPLQYPIPLVKVKS